MWPQRPWQGFSFGFFAEFPNFVFANSCWLEKNYLTTVFY